MPLNAPSYALDQKVKYQTSTSASAPNGAYNQRMGTIVGAENTGEEPADAWTYTIETYDNQGEFVQEPVLESEIVGAA